jgi:UDP-N-acetylglucosamine acyltransferase
MPEAGENRGDVTDRKTSGPALSPQMIHSTAVIHPKAGLDSTVVVGPYAVIDEGVIVGSHCTIGPHAYLTGQTTVGAHNQFDAGCVIGGAPQDLKYKGEPTRLRIANHNIFREHVTINRSNKLDEDTIVGSNNLLMANSHVGHNSILGDHVILANGALLGGHALVQDRAFISGNCLVHQFVRVGRFALMQGGSAISKDLPPFCIARGDNGICGLNVVGLRRAGFSGEQRLELKRLYHLLFRSGKKLSAAVAEARDIASSEGARVLIDFIASTKRGLCADTSMRDKAAEAEFDSDET